MTRSSRLRCAICTTSNAEATWSTLPNCGHVYHTPCIDRWISTKKSSHQTPTCPDCRQPAKCTVFRQIPKERGGDGKRVEKVREYTRVLWIPEDLSSDPGSQSQSQFGMNPMSDPMRFAPRREGDGEAEEEEEIEDDEEEEEEGDVVAPLNADGDDTTTNSTIASLRSELVRLRQEVREATQTVRDTTAAKRALELRLEEVDQLRLENEQLNRDNIALEEEKTTLSTDLAEKENELERLLAGDLQADIEELELNVESLMGMGREREKEIEKLKRERTECEDDAKKVKWELEGKIRVLEKHAKLNGDRGRFKIDDLEKKVDRLDSEILHLKASKDGLELTHQTALKSLSKSHESSLALEKEQKEAAKRSQSEAEEKLRRLQDLFERQKNGYRSLERQLAKSKEKNSTLNKRKGTIQDDDEDLDSIPLENDTRPSPSPRAPIPSSSKGKSKENGSVLGKRPTSSKEEIVLSSDEEGGEVQVSGSSKKYVKVKEEDGRDYDDDDDEEDLGMPTLTSGRYSEGGGFVGGRPAIKEGTRRGGEKGKEREREREMSVLSQDKHLPDFLGGGSVFGRGPKNKVGLKAGQIKRTR